jgi:hypothetical protein
LPEFGSTCGLYAGKIQVAILRRLGWIDHRNGERLAIGAQRRKDVQRV